MVAVILAGGENKRFPVNKCLLKIDGRRVIERNIELLSKYFKRIIISTNNPELYFRYRLQLVGDVLNIRGPMTGIYSVLNLPDVSSVFVFACDMPFINGYLVKYMLDRWSEEYDVMVPVFNGVPQPLHGIYSKTIAESMEMCLKTCERSLCRFIMDKKVYYINEEVVKSIDLDGKAFININTLEDYEKGIGGKICLV